MPTHLRTICRRNCWVLLVGFVWALCLPLHQVEVQNIHAPSVEIYCWCVSHGLGESGGDYGLSSLCETINESNIYVEHCDRLMDQSL